MTAVPHVHRRAALLHGAAEVPEPPLDKLLTTKQVAEFLACSVSWLEQARARHEGPRALKISTRRCRYRLSDVLTWVETFASPPAAPTTKSVPTKASTPVRRSTEARTAK